jgi:hypothetical protein
LAVGGSDLTRHGAVGRSSDDFHVGDVVLGAGEASGIVDSSGTGCGCVDFAFVQVLREDDEPAGAKHAGVDGVDDRVDNEDESKTENLERLLRLPDCREEPCDQSEDYEGVYVVAELESVQLEASKKREDSIEASDFVEEEGKEDEFGGGAEGNEA